MIAWPPASPASEAWIKLKIDRKGRHAIRCPEVDLAKLPAAEMAGQWGNPSGEIGITVGDYPGNNMKPFAFKKEAEIHALLAYLATFDPEGMAAQ